jgi:hypothetical protein
MGGEDFMGALIGMPQTRRPFFRCLLAAGLLVVACGPAVDDDDDATTPADDDDSTLLDDDDSAVVDDDDSGVDDDDDSSVVVDDDDDVTPDPSCIRGYEPLAVMDGFDGEVRSIAVHTASSTFAVLAEGEMVFYDVSDPWNPAELDRIEPGLLGSDATWTDIAGAEWGFAALGQTVEAGVSSAHTLTVEVGGSTVELGTAESVALGLPQADYTGPRAIATDGDQVALLTSVDVHDGSVEYYTRVGLSLVHNASSPFYGSSSEWENMALDGQRAIVRGVVLVITEPGEEPVQVSGSGSGQRPLRLSEGWLVPTTTTATGPTPLYLLDVDNATIVPIGQAYSASDGYSRDGAFQGTIYEGELFLAQSANGLVRTAWQPPTIDAVPTMTGADTQDIWTEGLGVFGPAGLIRIERIDGILFVLGWAWNDHPVGILRICPQ